MMCDYIGVREWYIRFSVQMGTSVQGLAIWVLRLEVQEWKVNWKSQVRVTKVCWLFAVSEARKKKGSCNLA